MDISLRGELWDNDSADVLRFWGWRDITAPMDIAGALERAGGEDVTLLVNSPGGDMAVGLEIRSMLRRYAGKTTALFQGLGASAATLAATGCQVIQSEPGALLCYHNPSGSAEGDWRDMAGASKSLKNAQDSILDTYLARPGCRATREELVSLMDKDIWITPTQAREYGLIDEIVGAAQEPEEEPAAFVAAAGRRIRLTAAMREQYQAHVAAERAEAARKDEAARTLARLRALAGF